MAKPRSAPTAGLPNEVGTFIGRSAALEALGRLLETERLVTIIGPAGIGKTRCAVRLGAGVGQSCFVDLADVRTAGELLGAVARTLGVALPGSAQGENESRLGAALAARGPALVLLDNAEYVAAEVGPVVARWLQQAPEARFLVTSIARLGVAEERCYELEPLPLEEAVALYEDRARRVGTEDPLADRGAVEALVTRLDGVPLAIELAAARSRVLRPRQLLGRLEPGHDALRGIAGGARHPSVAAALRWSWGLLAPPQAAALAQCAVFAGGFTLDAAEHVLAVEDESPILDLLEALRDRSFVQLDTSAPTPRFRLLESVRIHAATELERAGHAAAVRLRHAAFFVDLANRGVDGAPDTGQLLRLLAERENIRAAHRHTREGPAVLAAAAALALARVLALEGPPVSEIGVLEAGVSDARQAGDPALLARLLRARAVAAMRHGQLVEAHAALDESLGAARQAGLQAVELHVEIERGRLACAEGRFDEARALLSAQLEVARSRRLLFLEGYASNLRGMVGEGQGRFLESAADFEAAREIFRRLDNRRFEAIALMNLGVVQAAIGRLADAASLFEKAIAAFREIEDRAGEADAVLNLGTVHVADGSLDEAEDLLRVGLRLEREAGNRRAEGLALAHLGLCAHDRGELRTARELLQQALTVFRACGDRHFHAVFLPFFAAVEASLGHHNEARADFAAARTYFEAHGDPGSLHTLEVLEAFLALADGAPAPSLEALLAEARGRVNAPAGTHRSSELAVALRLLERTLRDRSGAAAPATPPLAASGGGFLELGPELAFFRVGDAPLVDLRRRRILRRILRTLVDLRLSAPGVGCPLEVLIEAGWPGDRSLPQAAAARAYVAIRSLRTLGLEPLLLHHDDGYLLDPAVAVRRAGDRNFRSV